MATKPEDINPFAQYVETPKAEPDINPFAKFEPYSVGTGLVDASKMIGAGLIGPTTAAPQGIESAARNIPRQVLEQQTIEVPEKITPMTFAEQLVKKGPAQLFTNVAKAFVKDATGESFEKQQENQKNTEIALDQLISKAPRIPGTEGLAKWGKGKSEDLTKSVSEVGRARIADSQIEGNLVKAVQDRSLKELSFGKDPSVMGYALQGSQVLGSLMPVIATALVTKGSPTAVGGLGFGMGAGEAVQNAQDHISKMSDLELAKASPYFTEMLKKGVNPAEARKVVTDKAAEYAAQLQGSVSAFGDVITGKLMTGQFDKLLSGPVKNKLGRIALGTTAGSAEEGTQEFLEGIASDIGINKAVIKKIGEDSFANFVLGAMGGAGPGAYRGAVAKTVEQTPPPAVPPAGTVPQVPPVAPVDSSLTPVKETPVAPAGALIEPEQVAQPDAVAPSAIEVAPVAPTAGLNSEVAKQVELLQKQYVELEKRKADPTNTPLEQEINAELQDEIKQKIEQIITAPVEAVEPVQVPVQVPEGAAPVEVPSPELQAPIADEVVAETVQAPTEEIVAPKGVTPDDTQAPKQYNFGSGNIDARVSQALDEEKYKEIYGTDGGILSFSLDGPGVNSETGFKSVAGITYEGKMTPERLEAMMANIASQNSKPEEKVKPTKEQQAEINRQRQEEKKAIAAAEAKIKARESLTPEDISDAGQIVKSGNGIEYMDKAKPLLKKLADAGLLTVKGKNKVFITKEAEEAGVMGGSQFSPFFDSEDMKKLKDFLSPETKAKIKEEVKAEKAEEISGVDQKFKIAQDISKYFLEGKSFSTILDARKFISGITGQKIEAGTAEAKAADETVEVGVVLAAQEIAKQDKTPTEIYDDLVDLYNRQPNLAVRSSTSVQEQAYSTPAPLAYVASQLADITQDTTVYEPTAGNGMLLIDANPKNVIANELNKDRFEMLKKVLPDAEVVNKNAIKFDPELSDRVIANPPFGAIGEEVLVSTFKTREIDHAIVYASLSRMPVNGKAVLIVGGVRADGEDARREGYRSAQKRNFYLNLYSNYNVVDHFSVAGSMYKKQGAAYPVDVIVIDGKGQSERALPAADLPQIISSYEQLKEKLNEPRMVSRERDSTARIDSGDVAQGERRPQDVGGSTVGQGVKPSDAGREPTGVSEPSVSEDGATKRGSAEPAGAVASEGQSGSVDIPERGNESGQPVQSGAEAVKPDSTASNKGNKPSELGGTSVVSGKRVESGLKERRGLETETEGQASYEPHSQATSVGTLVPRAMKDAIDASLNKIEDQVGNLDEYVADALGMDPETLRDDFSAEQIDALALAIQNAEAGKGFIIGDQTGIGKGRVVAAMIKYAIKNGKIPIFVTEKPNLYSDMIRDLDDIGMTKELALDTKQPKIFITNGGESIPYQLIRTGKDGEITETNLILKAPKSGKALDDLMKDMRAKESLGDYKVIFTTYSQMQTVKNKPTERQGFIKEFGLNNYMIFDESHNAGGGGETDSAPKGPRAAEKEKLGPLGRAAFVRELVNNAYGTFFSSATYAKRPDVMDLYSSTDMKLAVDKISQLSDSIKRGGVPMQQVVANMLTKAGQYIRRERTFAGVSYNTTETKVDKQTAENMASAMRAVLGFSRSKEAAIKQIQKELDKVAGTASIPGESIQIQGANFGSVMHNLIDQMLLSLKAQSSIDHAIERLKAGEKVVMTVSNTMGSFLQSYAEDMGINTGDPVNLSFSDLYQRYLEKQRMVTIKGPQGKVQRRLTDAELGPTLVERYKQIQKQIADSGFGSAPISPIDYMHNELRKAGYKTDEITGRTNTLDYSSGTPLLATRSANIKQRVGAVRGFNNGETDVIILNQAGSTGLSLHASDKFKDQRKRHMIIVQPEKNIDTHMQMLGRVHRTGQIIAPAYSQMMADIPAEMRPAAVLLKKMASLNANTTASRKSSVTAEGVVDFMNEYGGQVVQEYLRDNPDVMDAIGGDKIIKLSDDPSEATEGDIRKFTGYVPILPIKEQEEIYKDIIDRYNELLERENSMGTNKLEAKAVDLEAETISKTTITEDKGEDSEFARPAVMEKVDVKRTVKPYSSQEVKDMIKENLDGKTAADVAQAQQGDLLERARPYSQERMEKVKEDGADEVKLNAIKGLLDMQYTHVKTILQTYRIGTPVSVTDSNGVYVYGVITDVTNAKRTVNPAAGSDWKMQIALANGDARSITLSFSQIGSVYKLEPQTYNVNYFNPETQQAEYVNVIDIFDKGATVRREKRWMVTGNILAGFANYPGQIMTYTKKDGTVGQGVLMSRQFDFEKEQKEAPVKLKSADDVMKFFTEIGGQAGTPDGIMRISMRGGNFTFMVPSSKQKGGTYFLDKDLINILGTDFYKRGSDMLANTYQDDKAKAAINYLLKSRGETLVTLTGTDKARELFQPPKVLEDIGAATDFKMSDLDQNAKSFTVPAGTRLFHGAHLTRAEEIRMAGKALAARQKEKSGGGQLTEGNLIWFGDKELAKSHSESAIDRVKAQYDEQETGVKRKAGEVFSTVTDRPYKLINYNYVLSESEAKKLTEALGLPDYKPMNAGDSVWQAAYRGHTNGSNVPKYNVPRAGTMSSPWPIVLDVLGYDGYYDQSGIAFAAKNAVYLGDEQTAMRIEDIGGITQQEPETRRQEIRKEQIKRQAELSRGITKITKEIVKGNIGLNVQRQLTQLTQDKEAIKSEIARTKEPKVTAEWFRTRASAENAAGNLTDATYAVVDTLAKRFPKMLDGLRLSVRSTEGRASGNFNSLERLITVYSSGSETQDRTMRHEIAHSLEQMMTPEAQIAVVESWGENLQKAIEKYTDLPHQNYFQAVLDYIEKPTEANYKKATNLVPEYEMYQYINPSEYWAVNAEKLMKASLGSPWARFVKGVQKIWEAIKSTLGMNNRYAVHQEFNRIMSGEQDRITHKMLVEYVTDNANALRFLNNVEDFDKQFEADGFANTPVKVSRSVKDRLLGARSEAKHIYDRMKTNPLMTSQAMGGKLVRAITYARNKNVWFGSGLERAELISQRNAGLDGMLRDSEGKAVASIAVTNALHAGHIGSEVILRGSLGYNQQTQMFQAVNRDFSMANVLMYKHDLIERVGLQRATNMINKFFEAKRSKSILDDYNKREKELLSLENEYANPKTSDIRMGQLVDDILDAKKALKSIGVAKKKVNMTKEQIKFYGGLEKENPELRQMLDEWTKVNDNMIDMMLFSRIISKQRAEQLKGIKDYVPWYRIQEDMQDVHEPSQMGGVRGLSNVGKLKLFKDTETDLDIDDIVDNMLHNVMMITRNSMRNYAANRVAQEYATRNKKGQIAVFPQEGTDPATGAIRTNILINGRRIVIEIKDPLIAEAVTGMENIDMPAVKMLSALANGLRRGITLWPEFQLKQLFMDAPTAALVSGVKDPNKLWAGTFRGFIKALKSDDPIVDMLKSYGIGGYQSYTRTPEKEYKQKIGLLEKNKFDMLMQKLDQIGDASDYAQRIAIYNRVKAETGDEMLALMQANNVIDFLKRGSGRTAQFLTKTVSFMNAYAQQIDVLAMTLVGGKLTGKSRAAALAQLAKTGAMFGMYAMLYSWAVGGHDDYEELDDQTKLRNIYVPKALTKEIGMDHGILLPMHTSASFFFKSIPELTYNIVVKEGTVNEMDATRIRKALATAAVDSLLGPNPVPTGIKPGIEIALNRNFFTGGTVTPRGLEGLDAASQFTANTSELGKVLSALTGNPFNEKRVLNPVEADHLVRSFFGTTGAALQWGSNLFSGERPTPRARDNPLFGSFIAPDIGRAPEDLFYGFKEAVDGRYKTYMDFMNHGDFDKADKYFDKYEKEIVAHDYISSMDNALRELNSQIRNIGKAKNDMTPDERREEITYLQRQKTQILDGVNEMRKEAGL